LAALDATIALLGDGEASARAADAILRTPNLKLSGGTD